MPKKQTKKSKKTDVGFELHRLGVFVEQSNDRWDLVAEQYGGIKKDIGEIRHTLNSHTGMIGKLAIDLAIVKEDVEFIKSGLKKKVDYDEFVALQRRVLLLEKKAK